MTPPGLSYWFGRDDDATFKKGSTFQTHEGVTGQIVSFYNDGMIRMRWRSRGWDFDSTLQVRIIPSKEKSIISFHHEKLQSGQQREELKKH
jgi:activator of HSP90 ATPase